MESPNIPGVYFVAAKPVKNPNFEEEMKKLKLRAVKARKQFESKN